jgi:hypothetical protein
MVISTRQGSSRLDRAEWQATCLPMWASGVLNADGDPPALFVNSYSEVSPDGRAHYPVVAAKLARMHAQEPSLTPEDVHKVTTRTLVSVGDDDQVRLEHAIGLYRTVPDCELAVVPGASHGLLVEKPKLCNAIIIDFLSAEPIATLAPIRRLSRPSNQAHGHGHLPDRSRSTDLSRGQIRAVTTRSVRVGCVLTNGCLRVGPGDTSSARSSANLTGQGLSVSSAWQLGTRPASPP